LQQAHREQEHAQRAPMAYRAVDWYKTPYMDVHLDGRRSVAVHSH